MRRATAITATPKIDGTDFYMFRSYEHGRQNYVTLMANYDPGEDPDSGQNYFELDENAVYDFNVNNTDSGLVDIEIIYSVIENMTRDRRDRSLDYKISDIDVPSGSWEAQVLEEIPQSKTR